MTFGPFAASVQKDELSGLKQARAALEAMREEPQIQSLRPAIGHLLDWVALRVDPKAQALVLAGRLNSREDADFGQDLIDLSFVVDRAPFTRAKPGQARAIVDPDPGSSMWAWIGAVSLHDEATALANWHVHQTNAWLLAALMATKPGDANPELLRQAAEVPSTDPGYIAITYHRLRLMPADAKMRTEPEHVGPALKGEGRSARNLFASLDAASASSFVEWLRMAGRKPAMIDAGDGSDWDKGETPDGELQEQICGPALRGQDVPLFTPPAADGLNTPMPLTVLAEAAESKGLAPNLRFALAQSTWARAALLGRPEIAWRMTPLTVDCRSAWKPLLSAYDAARDPDARRVAALLALMRFASTEPNVRARAQRTEGFATYLVYRDNWWLQAVTVSPSAMASYVSEFSTPNQTQPNVDPVELANGALVTGSLSFLTPEERIAAHAEVTMLAKIPGASDYFAVEALAGGVRIRSTRQCRTTWTSDARGKKCSAERQDRVERTRSF